MCGRLYRRFDQLKADRRRLDSQLEVARNAHKRNETLYRDGIIPLLNLRRPKIPSRLQKNSALAAEATLKSAESSLSSAKENVRVAEFSINGATARLKEFKDQYAKNHHYGTVQRYHQQAQCGKRRACSGYLQMAGTEMMRIANLHSMEVQSNRKFFKAALGSVTYCCLGFRVRV
jgi:HlyD family secretion protein